MSGFNAHYFFGTNHLQLLDNSYIKDCCRKHPGVFSIGLQGPDIFFYFVIAGFLGRKNLGSLVHVKETNRFFYNMYRGLELFDTKKGSAHDRYFMNNKEIAVAYMSGFLGHFILDANTHPYIYGRTRYSDDEGAVYFGRHVFLETDIDRLILEHFTELKPSEFYQERTIKINNHECRVITDLLYYTFKKTYPSVKAFRPFMQGALYSIQLGCMFFRDVHGCKKAWLRKLEEITWGFPLISPLIPSDDLLFFKDPMNLSHKKWSNPWDQTTVSNESFMDLFDKAGSEYLTILAELNDLLVENRKRLSGSFLRKLANRSYHSGLDCRIPS